MSLLQLADAQTEAIYRQRLCALVHNSPRLMLALQAAARLELDSWCIAAGAIRTLVWRHIFPFAKGCAAQDLDLAYLNQSAIPDQRAIEAHLRQVLPELNWEVTNQALVHTWYRDHRGHTIAPLNNLAQALAGWPETATAVGVYLDTQGELQVIAPFGLSDLFAGIVRHNAGAVDISVFQARLQSKAFLQHWPELQLISAVS